MTLYLSYKISTHGKLATPPSGHGFFMDQIPYSYFGGRSFSDNFNQIFF